MRVMIDATHDGLAAAMPVIRSLALDDVVALYDTGSPDIAATPADQAQIPGKLSKVFIDQGFTGSPNLKATIRDCENGAWALSNAVNRAGWDVPRPTLYLGFPDTAQKAYAAGWRGDVWLVMPAGQPPVSPPPVPNDINVVAVQWDFKNPNYDVSVIFDPTWPGGKVATPPTPTVVPEPPPGQWKDAQEWTWKYVLPFSSIGLDGKEHIFAYNPATGKWTELL